MTRSRILLSLQARASDALTDGADAISDLQVARSEWGHEKRRPPSGRIGASRPPLLRGPKLLPPSALPLRIPAEEACNDPCLSNHSNHAPQAPPRGVYIHGGVGCGKTAVMDIFFDAMADAPKRRLHFNEFMLEVHSRLKIAREKSGSSDAVQDVAMAMLRDAWLLCFDEFQVACHGLTLT
jgi:hypothetical protein